MWISYCWGEKVFTKNRGFFGEKEECANCHKIYSPAFVRSRTWLHVNFIPIFPEKTIIHKMCPICGASHELKTREAKPLMVNKNKYQDITTYAKHVLHKQPKNKWTDFDKSYELWIKDNATHEEFFVEDNLTKDDVKNIKKKRGLKKLEIITVQ